MFLSQEEKIDFSKFGRSFQDRLCHIILNDRSFSEQIGEVLENNYFELKYLREFVKILYEYKEEYGYHPSKSIIQTILDTNYPQTESELNLQLHNYYEQVKDQIVPLNEEGFIKDKALDFCKKQNLKKAMAQCYRLLNESSFDQIKDVINEALKLGVDNDFGFDFIKDFEKRYEEENRIVIPTPWAPFNDVMGGGLAKGETGIIIAPTGCHSLGTKILMFDGSSKNVEDIVKDDLVMGVDGEERKVVATHRGKEEMYRIFPFKGKSFDININHILSLKNNKTWETLNIPFCEYLTKDECFRRDYSLYRIQGVRKDDFFYESLGQQDFYGFMLEEDAPDSLYLLDDFTVMHNCGKSMVGVAIGAQALKDGFNVVYYTLELADSVIGKRFDSCITEIDIDDLSDDKERVLEIIKDVPGQLLIKSLIPKRSTVAHIDQHLNKCETRGFKPDMIIVDYGDLLKSSMKTHELRHQLGSIFDEMIGLAKQHNVVLWTMTQSNRNGLELPILTMQNVAEAYNKCFGADFICCLARTTSDRQTNQGRFKIEKNRNGVDGEIYPIRMRTANVSIEVFPPTGETPEEIIRRVRGEQDQVARETITDIYNNLRNRR